MDESVESTAADSCSGGESINLSVLNWEQVQRLDAILTGSIPIHGRWSFPTLEVKPRDIVKVVRSRMEEKRIQVREVRLNGSAASYVLHEDSGLGWKDLDLIFCAELKGEMEFQIVKDIVLDSLLDFLPEGVNKEKITPVTLKVVYGVITNLEYIYHMICKADLTFCLKLFRLPKRLGNTAHVIDVIFFSFVFLFPPYVIAS